MNSIFVLLFSLLFHPNESNTHTLEVNVSNVPSAKGNVFVGLYRPKDEWPLFGKQFKGKIVQAVKGTTSVTFENLPEGTYALAVYHDENKSGVLDKNLVGMPTEVYGFSNNARRTFSAPTFEEAKFTVQKDTKHNIWVK